MFWPLPLVVPAQGLIACSYPKPAFLVLVRGSITSHHITATPHTLIDRHHGRWTAACKPPVPPLQALVPRPRPPTLIAQTTGGNIISLALSSQATIPLQRNPRPRSLCSQPGMTDPHSSWLLPELISLVSQCRRPQLDAQTLQGRRTGAAAMGPLAAMVGAISHTGRWRQRPYLPRDWRLQHQETT